VAAIDGGPATTATQARRKGFLDLNIPFPAIRKSDEHHKKCNYGSFECLSEIAAFGPLIEIRGDY
jgi:hypothetical protein